MVCNWCFKPLVKISNILTCTHHERIVLCDPPNSLETDEMWVLEDRLITSADISIFTETNTVWYYGKEFSLGETNILYKSINDIITEVKVLALFK